jgi:hypothetical protein
MTATCGANLNSPNAKSAVNSALASQRSPSKLSVYFPNGLTELDERPHAARASKIRL